MGRDSEYPLTSQLEDNLRKLLTALNYFRTAYGKAMYVSSGYRPGHYNKDAGGAPKSNHLLCLACDFSDPQGELDFFAANRLDVLERAGLYLEMPSHTPGWCHLQCIAPNSGNRIFLP